MIIKVMRMPNCQPLNCFHGGMRILSGNYLTLKVVLPKEAFFKACTKLFELGYVVVLPDTRNNERWVATLEELEEVTSGSTC